MGTAPPGLLSWQPRTLSHSHLNHKRKQSSRKQQHLKDINVGRVYLAKWGNRSQRKLQDTTRNDAVFTNPDTINLPSIWKGRGLPDLVHRKMHHHRYVCCAADNGALFSSADLSVNGAYDSRGAIDCFKLQHNLNPCNQ